MATTRTMKATVRRENGHQVIVLPDDIQFEGDEVILRQDVESGEVTLSDLSPQDHWQALFAAIDSHGSIPDEEWDAFEDRIRSARVSRANRVSFDDSESQ